MTFPSPTIVEQRVLIESRETRHYPAVMPGPYVQLATFCEKVLQEQDGVLSIIRAIDRIILTGAEGAPSELPEGGTLQLTLAVALKADDAQGRHPVALRVQSPSGVFLPEQRFDVMFEGGERGVNLILNLGLEAVEGLYWVEIVVSDSLVTRVPLRVMYQRVPGAS